MGKRLNPAAIGGFIVGAVVLIIVGLLVFSRGQFLSDKRTFVMYFDASVKGLNIGAPVDFQGVRVGQVTDIQVRYNAQDGSFQIPVFAEIEVGRIQEFGARKTREDQQSFQRSLIDRGMRAQLQSQSLVTGQLFVQLGFHPDAPPRFVSDKSDIPELPTVPTTLQQASQAAQDLLEKIKQLPLDELFANVMGITRGLNALVNSPELVTLMHSLSSSSATVQQLVQRVDGQLGRVLDDVAGMTTATHALVGDMQQLVRTTNTRVGPLADGAKETLDVARGAMKDGQQLLRHADSQVPRLMDSLVATSKSTQTTLTQVQRRLDEELVAVLQEVGAAARAIRVLADTLERNPSILVYGKGGDRR
jgi:paraquat-inducible protein B